MNQKTLNEKSHAAAVAKLPKVKHKPHAFKRADFDRFLAVANRVGMTPSELAELIGYSRSAPHSWPRDGAPEVAVFAAEAMMARDDALESLRACGADLREARSKMEEAQFEARDHRVHNEQMRAELTRLKHGGAAPEALAFVIAVPKSAADLKMLRAVCEERMGFMVVNPPAS